MYARYDVLMRFITMAYSRCFKFNFSLEFVGSNELVEAVVALAKFALFNGDSQLLFHVSIMSRSISLTVVVTICNSDWNEQFAVLSCNCLRSRVGV